jgi:DNA-binding transcriptional LysR family regulator
VRIEALGDFPISLIVRQGHPLLTDPEAAGFPLLVSAPSSVTGQSPSELLRRTASSIHVFEDFGSLADITRTTDAIWLTSAYAVARELEAGTLCELPWKASTSRRFSVLMYSLDRRSQSPVALELKQAFRQEISRLGRAASG